MHKQLAQILKFPSGDTVHGPTGLPYPAGGGGIAWLIGRLLPYIFAAAGFGLLLMIVSAGFSLLTSAGDPKQMEAAKSRLTNGLIGFFIIFLAYWIVQIAGFVLGIEEIGTIFK